MLKSISNPILCFVIVLLISFQTEAQKGVNQNITGFTALHVSSGIDVYLSQGTNESVEIDADEDIIDEVIIEKKNNTLIIKVDRSFMSWFTSSGSIKAYVKFKDLEEIQISGGSDLRGEGALKFDKIRMNASGGSDIKISLKANELNVQSSGGSDIELIGYSAYFEGSASGGSDIKGKDLETEVANISSSGGSDAHISVSRKLVASASGGSDIYYYGNPEEVDENESGGSDITKR